MRDVPTHQREVEIATERNGDEEIRVSVRDYGSGIAEEARGKLFQQFFTTRKEGLGMGLAIVRSIVEAHGGRIEARNEAGGGASFSFTIPISNNIITNESR
jgi:signal transduction histidine kinase